MNHNLSDDISDIDAFYSSDPQREHTRLEQHQLEYDLTWRFLTEYLPTQGSILEVGAATGRYTVGLAKRGYSVTAVDLSAALLETCRTQLIDEGLDGQVQLVTADARDLSQITAKEFDAVLVMGPLYHLIVEADRKQALSEAFDRLKNGGLIFTAWLSRFGVLSDLIRNNPRWIENQVEVESVVAKGHRPDDAPRGGFRGYLSDVSEIVPLHEIMGLETITLSSVEPIIAANDESYNQLEGTQREKWLDLLYQVSAEPSILGLSRHLIYIGRKK